MASADSMADPPPRAVAVTCLKGGVGKSTTAINTARELVARPLTAADVVDELGIARRTAHNKLTTLVEQGELETRKVRARACVWWRPVPREDPHAQGTA